MISLGPSLACAPRPPRRPHLVWVLVAGNAGDEPRLPPIVVKRATLLYQAGRRPCLRLLLLAPHVAVAQYMCYAIGCWSNQGHVSFSVIATAAPLLLAIAPSLPTMLGHLPSCSDARQGIRRQQLWFYVAGSVLQTAGRVLGKYLMIDIISIRVS